MDLTWLLAPPLPEGVPTQRLLYQRLRAAIVDGRLAAGTRLPGSRQLASELGIARNTVLFAYEQLGAEGCLLADRQGTRVAALAVAPVAERPASWPALARRAALAASPLPAGAPEHGAFAPGVPDVANFPFRAWRGCLDRAWRTARPRHLGYAVPGGEPALRAALAGYLAAVRGFRVRPEQVVVTAGTQAALELCARLLADSGDTVWVEDPGYPAARTALAMAGLRLHPVPVDGEGMAPATGDWQAHPPRLVLVCPAHQYPSGEVLSLPRRLALIEGVRASGGWLIEDDYDSEFARGGPALPALFGLQPEAPVVYTGTFSKTLYPGLRLGYLVVPEALAETFVAASATLARAGQGIEQAALADFIQRGHYTAHLRRMRRLYQARQRALREALARWPGPELAVRGGAAGLHLVLRLPDDLRDVDMVERAAALGVTVRALSRYALGPAPCNGLLLGYGAVPEAQMDDAVRRLRRAMRG
ncbi:MocR-like pyridoxine biosynthesis transcription factor PdxR [Denitromonas iodatirespirans]|uniref:PLP-dependent aminotransferase family protein n=1 Tax=Denitromonas iodatirespirans TaxID=2795389 RepID=A0A944H9B3_DENI1|nr:PLP-dependent aminotransferase family protein [Denitromonas iodatirespirans]MBT0963069.1 PLP-dependent aminotransferase family protein [Denitromonas iodatirespirans]